MHNKLIALGASIGVTTIGLALIAPPAFAQTLGAVATPDTHITYGDLNLASIGGENALRARVETAVRNNCAGLADRSSGIFAEVNCRTASQKEVDPQIARAVLRAREFAATGTSRIPPVTIALPK